MSAHASVDNEPLASLRGTGRHNGDGSAAAAATPTAVVVLWALLGGGVGLVAIGDVRCGGVVGWRWQWWCGSGGDGDISVVG